MGLDAFLIVAETAKSGALDPLADGWIVGVAGLLVGLVPTLYSIVSKWKQRERELEALVKKLEAEAVERTNALNRAELSSMFSKARIEDLEHDLDFWRGANRGTSQ